MNKNKPRTVISMIMILVIASQVVVPTIYNAKNVNEEKIDLNINTNDIYRDESTHSYVLNASVDSQLNINFYDGVNTLIANAKYFMINKQLDISQGAISLLSKNIINIETQAKKVGEFAYENILRSESEVEAILENYNVMLDDGNRLFQTNNFQKIEKNKIAIDIFNSHFINLEYNYKSRDGPKILRI